MLSRFGVRQGRGTCQVPESFRRGWGEPIRSLLRGGAFVGTDRPVLDHPSAGLAAFEDQCDHRSRQSPAEQRIEEIDYHVGS